VRGTVMNDCCQNLQSGRLVDYADGLLSPTQRLEIEQHLAQCADCRQHLVRLERSLEIAREIFQQAAEAVGGDVSARTQCAHKRISRVWVAALVSAATILVVLLPQVLRNRGDVDGPDPDRPDALAVAVIPQTAETDSDDRRDTAFDQPDAAEGGLQAILAEIERAERRARLMASWELLSTVPELESYAAGAHKYITTTFGDIAAGGHPDDETPKSQPRKEL
jgi:predicted anti-sigma-YlaC factor YlaD